jgi:hypothetical protein
MTATKNRLEVAGAVALALVVLLPALLFEAAIEGLRRIGDRIADRALGSRTTGRLADWLLRLVPDETPDMGCECGWPDSPGLHNRDRCWQHDTETEARR